MSDTDTRTCVITGNPCGTDTWPVVEGRLRPCACSECKAYVADHTIAFQTFEHPTEGTLVRPTFFPDTERAVTSSWQRSRRIDRKTWKDEPCSPAEMIESMHGSVLVRDDGAVETAPELRAVCKGESSGAIDEPGLQIEWGGNCPVQGSGMVDGVPMYYRARGSGWSVEIGLDVDKEDGLTFKSTDGSFYYDEHPYIWPDGGWISTEESERNIRHAVAVYRAQRSSDG